MKPNRQPENEENLDRALRQWTVDAPLPPRFQERVWQRIERPDARPKTALWPVLLGLADLLLPRPRLAFAYAAVLLAAGVGAGSWAAQVQSSRLDAALGLRYVQSVDPYKTVALDR